MKKVITAIVLATAMGTASAQGFYDNAPTKWEDIKSYDDIYDHCFYVGTAFASYITFRATEVLDNAGNTLDAVKFLKRVDDNLGTKLIAVAIESSVPLKANYKRNLKTEQLPVTLYMLASQAEMKASNIRASCMASHYKRLLDSKGAV